MERKAMEDREQPAGLDSPGQASAPVTDDATGGGAEGVFGSPWWESGAGPEEAAEEEPDTYRGTGYIYRGVRYGEPVSEPKSQPAEDPGDDDDPVDLTVLAVMSEDRTAVPPAEGEEADEPVIGAPWWQAGSMLEEAAEEEPGAESETEETPLAAHEMFKETGYGEPLPEPETEAPDDGNDPVAMSMPAVMSEDQPAVLPPKGRTRPVWTPRKIRPPNAGSRTGSRPVRQPACPSRRNRCRNVRPPN
jgi:hypothetical protein